MFAKNKKVEINGNEYLIKELDGSWKIHLAAKKAMAISEAGKSMAGFESLDTNSSEYRFAIMGAMAARFDSKDFIAFTKELTIEAVQDPEWTTETWEAYFSKNFADLSGLFDAIMDFNLGEGDKKKESSTESEKALEEPLQKKENNLESK